MPLLCIVRSSSRVDRRVRALLELSVSAIPVFGGRRLGAGVAREFSSSIFLSSVGYPFSRGRRVEGWLPLSSPVRSLPATMSPAIFPVTGKCRSLFCRIFELKVFFKSFFAFGSGLYGPGFL